MCSSQKFEYMCMFYDSIICHGHDLNIVIILFNLFFFSFRSTLFDGKLLLKLCYKSTTGVSYLLCLDVQKLNAHLNIPNVYLLEQCRRL